VNPNPDSIIEYALRFSFSVLRQTIGWEERLWKHLYRVGWDVKP